MSDEAGRWFYSGEHIADPSLRPTLTLEYSYVDIQRTSLGEMKAMFKQLAKTSCL